MGFHNGDIPAGLFFITGLRPGRSFLPLSLFSTWLNNQKFLQPNNNVVVGGGVHISTVLWRRNVRLLSSSSSCLLCFEQLALPLLVKSTTTGKRRRRGRRRTRGRRRRLAPVVFAAVEINLRGSWEIFRTTQHTPILSFSSGIDVLSLPVNEYQYSSLYHSSKAESIVYSCVVVVHNCALLAAFWGKLNDGEDLSTLEDSGAHLKCDWFPFFKLMSSKSS